MKKIIIAIDGYSGTGKSSTAKAVAAQMGYTYIDSGAMYRAITYQFLKDKVDLENQQSIQDCLRDIQISFSYNEVTKKSETCLNGNNVEGEIRGMEISKKVSAVSTIKEVRQKLVSIQREIGVKKGVVMDGRDIGTVVFPDAELKIFMTADTEVRAHRRQQELMDKGMSVDLGEIMTNLEERDRLDSSREHSPLKQAEDAKVIDTSKLTFQAQVEQIISMANALTKP